MAGLLATPSTPNHLADDIASPCAFLSISTDSSREIIIMAVLFFPERATTSSVYGSSLSNVSDKSLAFGL